MKKRVVYVRVSKGASLGEVAESIRQTRDQLRGSLGETDIRPAVIEPGNDMPLWAAVVLAFAGLLGGFVAGVATGVGLS